MFYMVQRYDTEKLNEEYLSSWIYTVYSISITYCMTNHKQYVQYCHIQYTVYCMYCPFGICILQCNVMCIMQSIIFKEKYLMY